MCCGQKRVELRSDGASHRESNEAAVRLLYYGRSPAHFRGSVTGRMYQFSRVGPAQPVDPRDATSMLQTRLFRRPR